MIVTSGLKIITLITFIQLYKKTKFKFFIKFINKLISYNGVFVIKLIQWLSTRPDILPLSLYEIFTKFKENCPSHSFKITETIIKDIMKDNYSYYFSSFDPIPIASGSIAQVYKATLRSTGKTVAVKVKHPGIEKNMDEYKKIMSCLLNVAKKIYPHKTNINIEEFYDNITEQISLVNEAKNANKFYEIFKNDPYVVIPKVIFTDDKLVIYEYYESNNIQSICHNNDILVVRRHVINFIYAAFKPLAINGFFHGDLHDGNWGINNNKIILYDFGHISVFDKNYFIKLTKATSTNDMYSFIYMLLTFIDKDDKTSSITNEINIKPFLIKNDKEIGKNIINTVMMLCHEFGIKVNSACLNMIFLLTIIEFYKTKYEVSNSYKNDDILFEELKNMSNETILKETFEEIIKYLQDYRFIKNKIKELLEKMRYTLKYFINIYIEDLILSLVNFIHISNILTPTEIIDTIKFIDKNINNNYYIDKINIVINYLKLNTTCYNINFVIKFQKNLFKLRDIYNDFENGNEYDSSTFLNLFEKYFT